MNFFFLSRYQINDKLCSITQNCYGGSSEHFVVVFFVIFFSFVAFGIYSIQLLISNLINECAYKLKLFRLHNFFSP